MSEYIGVVTNKGQQKIAAAIGGAVLDLALIRVGDGNGAPIVPSPIMTDLVRRVGTAYPIISSGRDPVNISHWRVTALIPASDGPFDIREIGIWDAAGDMIAVAKHVLVEKRSPAQGAAVELVTDIVFAVSESAQVTIQVQPQTNISISQMLRAGFCTVNSASVAAPPATPAIGDTYAIAANPTGAWNGLYGRLAQWNGSVWVTANVPIGFLIVDEARAADHFMKWLRRTATGWASAEATELAYGVARRAKAAEITSESGPGFITPGQISQLAPIVSLQSALATKVDKGVLNEMVVTTTRPVTVPAAVTRARVRMWAAGSGGGGTGATSGTCGAGGGGGEYREGVITVTPGAIMQAIIGAGGLGGAAGAASTGQAGGDTSFGGIVAKGGQGGFGSNSGFANGGGAGGTGGTGGDLAVPGVSGESGFAAGSSILSLGGGASWGCGHSHFVSSITLHNGVIGMHPGQGGGGGIAGGSGGRGADGLMIIEWLQ